MLVLVSALLMALDHREELLRPARFALAGAVYPVHWVASLPAGIGELVSEGLTSRRELARENDRLRAQKLRNEARLQKLDTLEIENIRLRELLDSAYEVGEPVLIAELMQVDLDPYSHLIQIDKGAGAGVYRGQPVLDANGIVGQVDQVGPFTAMVRLISDPSHAIPVQLNRNGVRSVAVGTGKLNELELISLPNNTDVRAGDLLVTSGLGGRFPAGYPVGRVKQVDPDPGHTFATITATPSGALDRIQEVLLVRSDAERRLAESDQGVPQQPSVATGAKDSGS